MALSGGLSDAVDPVEMKIAVASLRWQLGEPRQTPVAPAPATAVILLNRVEPRLAGHFQNVVAVATCHFVPEIDLLGLPRKVVHHSWMRGAQLRRQVGIFRILTTEGVRGERAGIPLSEVFRFLLYEQPSQVGAESLPPIAPENAVDTVIGLAKEGIDPPAQLQQEHIAHWQFAGEPVTEVGTAEGVHFRRMANRGRFHGEGRAHLHDGSIIPK